MKKIFDFKEQLKLGTISEKKFIKLYHSKLTIIEDRYADFLLEDGRAIELKSDNYDHSKTDNFFIERYSSIEAESPGSFWQSEPKGVSIFIYYFPKNNCYYEFTDLPKVIKELDDIISKGTIRPTMVPNKGWTGMGYKIPRELLKKYWTFYKV